MDGREATHAELVAACRLANFKHQWVGSSPRRPTDGPEKVRVHRPRYSVHTLNHKGAIRMKRSHKMKAGGDYLNSAGLGKNARVAVRDYGGFKIRGFKGVLWVGSACFHISETGFKILRVCQRNDVTVVYAGPSGYVRRETLELSNFSLRRGVPETKGRLLLVETRPATRCIRQFRSLAEGYAEIAVPGHRMIYATPGKNTPHPCALINKSSYIVCPTCHKVFHNTVDLCKHWGIEGRMGKMAFKTFI